VSTADTPRGSDRRKSTSLRDALLKKIDARHATVGVIGLGYVGLPVACTFAEMGWRVFGVDTSPEKIASLKQGISHVHDVEDETVRRLCADGGLSVDTEYAELRRADAILISVPTPILDGNPDLSAIKEAGTALGEVLSEGTLVILESTTYPGTTEEILRPLLERSGLKAGRDFLLAFSPERIDPGNETYGFQSIPKVVGGINPESTSAAEALYSQVVPKVVAVSGTREAEMAKLIENTFRHVNIALINELAVYAHELGIDIWESIEAAATKPFGFLPFWPGPGWGGHCIPLDPSYLSWRVRRDRAHEVRFVELAHTINSEMSRHVVERVSWLLNEHGKATRGARILGIGVAYKGGTDDTRHSAGLKVLAALADRGARITYHDPQVPEVAFRGRSLRSVALTATNLGNQDLVVVLVPQEGVDWGLIAAKSPLVLDCCNALKRRTRRIRRL
jgi:UDP-N-acetyl-D-glucosamine dehydrogenase